MKRTHKFLSFGMAILMVCLAIVMVGCNEQNKPETAPEKIDEAIENEIVVVDEQEVIELTVDDILSRFSDPKYFIQEYDREMIASIEKKLVLKGSINRVIHITDQSNDDKLYAYVYEFEQEADAISFEENRKAFVSGVENGNCIRFGKIVVFGNSSVIPIL